MAITGIALMGFVLAHMIGNLKMYLGPDEINHYGEFLRELLVPLLPRTVHAVDPAHRPDRCRGAAHPRRLQPDDDQPRGPLGEVPERARLPGRQLRQPHDALDRHHRRCCSCSGTSPTSPGAGSTPTTCAATCTATSMRRCPRVPVAILYIVANIALGIHLFHGAWSLFQSMGWNNPRFNKWRRGFAIGFATLIVVGNVSFPIAVLAGIVGVTMRRDHDRRSNARRQDPRRPHRADKWDNYKSDVKLVNPNNKRKFKIIVVGTGLAGASAAATLAELGYQVDAFTFHDSPRRAHSIAAQGGINAAKNYRGDGDSIHRLFYDTVKGGDFRSREANVHRLAQVSVDIIDQMVAQGVPFAREYGGLLDNRIVRRRAGQPHVLRPRPDRPAAAARRLPAAGPPDRPRRRAPVQPRRARRHRRDRRPLRRHRHPRPDRPARSSRTPHTPSCWPPAATATCSSCRPTRWHCNVTAAWRAHRRGAYFANPCYTQIHPTCIPQSRRHPVEADADERVAAQRRPGVGAEERRRQAARRPDPRRRARLLPRAAVPELRQPRAARHLVACRQARRRLRSRRRPAEERRVPRLRRRRSTASATTPCRSATGTCSRCTSGSPARTRTKVPMRIYPASHYTMGGLWVDYELMTTVPGLYCAGEANFSDHGANRLGASALMQGLADGYFVLPYTIGNYLAPLLNKPIARHRPPGVQAGRGRRPRSGSRATSTSGAPARPTGSTASSARSSGTTAAWSAPSRAWRRRCRSCPRCTTSSRRTCVSPATAQSINQTLEKAGRVDDFFQLGMLMCRDALERSESCGGHFRAEYQDEEGEAKRDDEHFAHVAAWEWTGDPMKAIAQRRRARVRGRAPRHAELQVSGAP